MATPARCSTGASSSQGTRRRPIPKQTNKNLVLSDDAVIDTKPELQIFADDVRCTASARLLANWTRNRCSTSQIARHRQGAGRSLADTGIRAG